MKINTVEKIINNTNHHKNTQQTEVYKNSGEHLLMFEEIIGRRRTELSGNSLLTTLMCHNKSPLAHNKNMRNTFEER